jgi:hypothetical protein
VANGMAVRFCQQCAVLHPVLGERQGAAALGAPGTRPVSQQLSWLRSRRVSQATAQLPAGPQASQ